MESIYRALLDWSEIWPLLISLTIYILLQQANKDLKQVSIYLYITLLLSIPAVLISNYRNLIPQELRNNNIFYNVIAFLKIILIGSYISNLRPMKQYRYAKPLLIIFVLFAPIHFIFLESPLHISQYFFAPVSIILLILCMTFFLTSIIDDDSGLDLSHPSFFICTGIAIFESVNFFIYLFIFELYRDDETVSLITSDIQSVTYIILYILFAIAIYKNSTRRWKVYPKKR